MLDVTHGHEVSRRRAEAHERYAHQILAAIDEGQSISQRSLAGSLGIALGMTNLLLKRLVRKGWVRVSHIRPNRVGYFLTPTGIAEKARMSRAYFQDSVKLYASARDRLRASFAELSAHWPAPADGAVAGPKRIVFLGTGEVAEIAYVCLQETDLHLAGVIDFQGRERFFGVPIFPAASFQAEALDRAAGPEAIVVAFSDSEQVRTFLDGSGLAAGRVHWM